MNFDTYWKNNGTTSDVGALENAFREIAEKAWNAEKEDFWACRMFFLQGVGLITQWDIASPGSDQCLRLLDYYGRLALASDDRELLLILNTVITAQIRENLQGKNGTHKKANYPFACEAMERISEFRKEDGLAIRDQKARANLVS